MPGQYRNMSNRTLTILAVGDIILGRPEAESFFALAAPVLKTGDIVVGQLEIPFTNRVINPYYLEVPTEIPSIPGCDPRNISAFAYAGFNLLTFAGNHTWDAGVPGIEDSIAGLRKHDIAFVGAGMNIAEARQPVIMERDGTRVGFLDYNCVGPKLTWATPDKPGCAYVHIITHYELDHPTPGSEVPMVYTFAEPVSMGAMIDDIKKLRPQCDILAVAFHKGMGFVPVQIAWYEQQISYAAIDAGADLILGQHAHILKGIEQYKGKTIFHNLGNFVGALQQAKEAPKTWAFQQWGSRMKDIFYGYNKPAPGYTGYFWHPETAQTVIAKCTINKKKISRVSYLPCMINKKGQPEVLKHDKRGQKIFDYMEQITRKAGLNGRYEWDGDEVVISSA
jgi:hypothetical protein